MTTSTTSESDSDLARTLGDDTDLARGYYDLFGELPPHVQKRWDTLRSVGRHGTVALFEHLRTNIVSDSPLDLRTQQLVWFGQLLVKGAEGPARQHAKAALRHGATVEDLTGVVETALLSDGITAFAMGVAIISEALAEAK